MFESTEPFSYPPYLTIEIALLASDWSCQCLIRSVLTGRWVKRNLTTYNNIPSDPIQVGQAISQKFF